MITPIVSWFVQIWTNLTTVIQHDWLFYALAVPLVGIVAWAWACLYPGKDGNGDGEE
jgi:hypothetical protein